ncbi:MAG: NAD-dependent epimerase/dehydratase family protein [Candidatus Dechloromonas phosphoritropha]
MESILVTGGAGNIGSALVRVLVERPDTRVVVADNLLTGSVEKIRLNVPNLVFVKSDCNDFDDVASLFYRFQFTHVFHFAAVVGVQRTLANPMLVLRDIAGIENILRLCKNTGVRRIYFSSSSEVYGEPFEIPQNENTTPLNSRLPYAVVKNVCEVYLRTFQREYELPYTIFRFFNTYGPRQSEDFVLPRYVRAALRGDPLLVYGDGSQTRTFCYVDDTVDTCVRTHALGAFENDVINVGSENEITILELARTVVRLSGSNSRIEFLPPLSEGDMTRRCPDISKMRQLLDRPLVVLEDGIHRLIEHYRTDTSANARAPFVPH